MFLNFFSGLFNNTWACFDASELPGGKNGLSLQIITAQVLPEIIEEA